MDKKALPHLSIKIKNKEYHIDLFFEYISLSDRKKMFRDLQNGLEIFLPNVGSVYGKNGILIRNDLKSFSIDNIDEVNNKLIKSMMGGKQEPLNPILQYDESSHSFKLRKKNTENMIDDLVNEHSKQLVTV